MKIACPLSAPVVPADIMPQFMVRMYFYILVHNHYVNMELIIVIIQFQATIAMNCQTLTYCVV
jgi:hypothetical protein